MRIDRLEAEGGKIAAVQTSAGRMVADAFVLALGSFSPLLARPLGIKLPVYPVKGYSITVPIVDASLAPESTVMDETYKIAITRLGDRIRVGGMAEIAGFDMTLHQKRRDTLVHSVEDLFGGAGDQSPRDLLVRLAPDDAGWHADLGPLADFQPVPEHRTWHFGLDDGGRARAGCWRMWSRARLRILRLRIWAMRAIRRRDCGLTAGGFTPPDPRGVFSPR